MVGKNKHKVKTKKTKPASERKRRDKSTGEEREKARKGDKKEDGKRKTITK